ncbi:Veg family protein [Holzapfeliella floricola]|uniref:Veg protein n=1 Tax=Holzapfeliella floricola DSM 23037 = JCM 16512 TaxID=1423744 RepID=A0A0R2DV11_9LACO|nr:Veg family protein [Holzapfeliella floricola]KRN04330.1 hypothetical protein FC86_GL000428 [Holzapfeliella floricola DSM 23037 = JCM 16512]
MLMTLQKIKQQLEDHIGEDITVVAQAGRKKITRRKGTLTKTYPSVFLVDLDQEENHFERASYSYTDLLTENIKLEFEVVQDA